MGNLTLHMDLMLVMELDLVKILVSKMIDIVSGPEGDHLPRFFLIDLEHAPRGSDVEFLSWFGGHSTSETPGSIPNPAVKHRCADGTAS